MASKKVGHRLAETYKWMERVLTGGLSKVEEAIHPATAAYYLIPSEASLEDMNQPDMGMGASIKGRASATKGVLISVFVFLHDNHGSILPPT